MIKFVILFTSFLSFILGDKVETRDPISVDYTSAVIKGVVNIDVSAYKKVEFGVLYSEYTINLYDAKRKSTNILSGKEFTVKLDKLNPGARYNYKAYILLDGEKYELGNQKEFITKFDYIPSGVYRRHEYIDLGLSVMWATKNVGAVSPEDYGDYYAWGETKTKSCYNQSTYVYSLNPKILNIYADAAYMNWGGNWRMPTREEIEELENNCVFTKMSYNGVKGCMVTSKITYNSIFFPFAAWKNDNGAEDFIGKDFAIWSSSLYNYDNSKAVKLRYKTFSRCDEWLRYYGLPIRPVLP